jgi:hypothetical protein
LSAHIVVRRWQDGFVCPKCSDHAHCVIDPRRLFQCNAGRRRTSPMASTIFNSTKLPLSTWFPPCVVAVQAIEQGRPQKLKIRRIVRF